MISESAGGYKAFNPFEGMVYPIPSNEYHPEILDVPGNFYYHGYWINKHWFTAYRDVFLSEFSFPEITDERNLSYLEQITTSPSVSIHIRRGDYVGLGWAFSPEQYLLDVKTFILRYTGNWHLFVFSDDIPWCKEHAKEMGFTQFMEVTFVEGNIQGENYRDMQLMSRCKGMMMSNSAFCYLAALLNTERQALVNLTDREV